MARTWAFFLMAWSSSSQIADRPSNPIHACASAAFLCVGLNSSPFLLSSGSSVESFASGANFRTNACDETKPRVKATLSLPGIVSRIRAMAAVWGSPRLSVPCLSMKHGVTR